jgi:hypothetical protein
LVVPLIVIVLLLNRPLAPLLAGAVNVTVAPETGVAPFRIVTVSWVL